MVEKSRVQNDAGDDSVTLRRVRNAEQAGDAAFKVTLFSGSGGMPCGWYIGPLTAHGGRLSVPYLPQSEETMASVAVVRAIRIAKQTQGTLCLVDPENLWPRIWPS